MTENLDGSFSSQCSISEFINSIQGFGRVTKIKLQNAGYETVGDLRKADKNELCKIDQIGQGTAESILDFARSRNDTSDISDTSDAFSTSNGNRKLNKDTPLKKWAEEVSRIGRIKQVHLRNAGYKTVGDLQEASEDDLKDIETIGETVAQKIVELVDKQSSSNDDNNEVDGSSSRDINENNNNSDRIETILSDLELADDNMYD